MLRDVVLTRKYSHHSFNCWDYSITISRRFYSSTGANQRYIYKTKDTYFGPQSEVPASLASEETAIGRPPGYQVSFDDGERDEADREQQYASIHCGRPRQ